MNKVIYKEGSFVNYEGTQVRFMLAAVSTKVPPFKKRIGIGAAFLHEGDTWDEKLGKTIAYGRAQKWDDHAIYITDKGLIGRDVIESILEKECDYIKVNPGRYIAGYDDAKKQFEAQKAWDAYMNSLTPDERLAIDVVAHTSDPDKFLQAVEKHRKSLNSTTSTTE